MRMTQTSKAARWKLQTSIKKPADKDITSLALVSKYEFQRENLLLRLPFKQARKLQDALVFPSLKLCPLTHSLTRVKSRDASASKKVNLG